MIKNNVAGEGKTREETQMILNHKDAFNEAVHNKDRFRKLSYADIEYIHSVLTKKLGISKNVRSGAVAIVGTKYKPLNNNHQIEKATREIVDSINQKDFFLKKPF